MHQNGPPVNLETVQAQVVRMVDLSWAAAVLDLHGNFTAPLRRDADRREMWGHFQPRITYRPPQVNLSAAKELERILGGRIGAVKGGGGKLIWTVTGAKACLAVDELVLPYLRVRTRRVQMHLELCRRIRDFKPASFTDRELPRDELEERAKIQKAMSRL